MDFGKMFDKVVEYAPAYIALTLVAQKFGYVGVGMNTPAWFRPAPPSAQMPAPTP